MPIVIICKSRLRIQDTYNWGDDEDEVEGGRQEEKGQILKQIAVKAFQRLFPFIFYAAKAFFFHSKTLFAQRLPRGPQTILLTAVAKNVLC